MFDGGTAVDIGQITVEDLSKSYGEGFTDLAVSGFNGES